MKVYMTGSEWFDSRPGGLNRYFQDLFGALQEVEGVDVTAHAFGSAPPGGESWGPVGLGLPQRLRSSQVPAARLRGAVIDRHFALYGPHKRIGGRHAAAFVVHFQGPWFEESRAAGAGELSVAGKRFFEYVRYSGIDAAVVLCEEFKDRLVNGAGVPEERVAVMAPGVDLARFRSTATSSDGDRVVLCVRRLEHRMGIDVLINAWPAVHERHPDVRLVIVGEGSEGTNLRRQAADMGLRNVSFTGRLDDEALTNLYSKAAVTVVPTRSLEGFGLIALESLASGRPVIVTRVGGLPDAVVGLDPSLVVAPEDPEALGARVVSALDGAAPSAEQCRAHAEQFSWAKVATRHVALYQDLIT